MVLIGRDLLINSYIHPFHDLMEVGGGRWEVGGGRWEVGGGRWEVGGGRWEVGGVGSQFGALGSGVHVRPEGPLDVGIVHLEGAQHNTISKTSCHRTEGAREGGREVREGREAGRGETERIRFKFKAGS